MEIMQLIRKYIGAFFVRNRCLNAIIGKAGQYDFSYRVYENLCNDFATLKLYFSCTWNAIS